MILDRWNYKARAYEPYEVPDTRKVAIYCEDLNALIDCAICGQTITYGESYTSLALHTEFGIGYCVCGKCHEEEIKHRLSFGATDEAVEDDGD